MQIEENTMQHMLTKGPLLNDKGDLNEAGYAFELIKDYKRTDIKGSKSRIKEWDYYFIIVCTNSR